MYVCICNRYRQADVEETAQSRGLCEAEEVYVALGAGPNCGQCLDFAQSVIDAAVPLRMMAAE